MSLSEYKRQKELLEIQSKNLEVKKEIAIQGRDYRKSRYNKLWKQTFLKIALMEKRVEELEKKLNIVPKKKNT